MIKKILVVTLSLCMVMATPALAASDLSRSKEEWAHLQDNTLEWYEIDDLIKEYNADVASNNFDLFEFRKKYGATNNSMSNEYRDMADELRSNIDFGDTSNPMYEYMYGTYAAQSLSLEQTAKQLDALADSSLEDYEINKLATQMAEKSIALDAREQMIAYYASILAAEKAGLNVELLSSQANIANVQASVGMATQADVLTKMDSLSQAQKDKISADTAVNTTKKKLQVDCGWKYEDDPVLGALPEPDVARVDTINPTNDLQTALDNNYTLKINKRKYDNATVTTTRDSLNTTMESNKQNIAVSLNNAYLAVTAARDAYKYASIANDLQQRSLSDMNTKYKEGKASKVEFRTQQITARTAEIALIQAKYDLLKALTNYDYQVAGLASA